jgi:transposase
VRWSGSPAPCALDLGGDRRSGVIEAHAQTILRTFEARRDMTIEELRRALAGQGLCFGYGTLWRFFARHKLTRKKRRRTPPSRTVLMC